MISFLLLQSSASGTLISTSGTLHKTSTSGAQHSISCEENSLYTLLTCSAMNAPTHISLHFFVKSGWRWVGRRSDAGHCGKQSAEEGQIQGVDGNGDPLYRPIPKSIDIGGHH
jgi:hypothetical protein